MEGISAFYISSLALIDGEDCVDEVLWGGGGSEGSLEREREREIVCVCVIKADCW